MEKIVDNYTVVMRKYSDFSGRADRAEYWYFVLANLLIGIGLATLSRLMGNDSDFLGSLYSLVVFLPGIAVGIRRLHDIGKSGWWLLLSFIPLVGAIWLIILLATDSNSEKNEYGPAPKKVEVE